MEITSNNYCSNCGKKLSENVDEKRTGICKVCRKEEEEEEKISQKEEEKISQKRRKLNESIAAAETELLNLKQNGDALQEFIEGILLSNIRCKNCGQGIAEEYHDICIATNVPADLCIICLVNKK